MHSLPAKPFDHENYTLTMSETNNSRRQFLKNTSLAALSMTALPLGLQGKENAASWLPAKVLDCDPTTLDFYGTGPFYTENPPSPSNNLLASLDEPGTRLTITGRVINLKCEEFIANTIIDVWQVVVNPKLPISSVNNHLILQIPAVCCKHNGF